MVPSRPSVLAKIEVLAGRKVLMLRQQVSLPPSLYSRMLRQFRSLSTTAMSHLPKKESEAVVPSVHFPALRSRARR